MSKKTGVGRCNGRQPAHHGGPLLFSPFPNPKQSSPEARALPGESFAVVRLVQLVEEVGARGHDPVRVERRVRPGFVTSQHMNQSSTNQHRQPTTPLQNLCTYTYT